MRGQGVLIWLVLGVGLYLGACAVDTVPPSGGGNEDSGADREDAGHHDRPRDGGGSDPKRDAGHDAAVDAGDSGTDAARDAETDAQGDPCASASCGAHATCSAISGSATCSCTSGYQDHDDDGSCEPSCASKSCPDHSTCADGSGAVVCTCRSGYQDNDGDGSCEPECGSGTCPTHSTCEDGTGTVVCTCTTGYSGATCTDTDACTEADAVDENPCNGLDSSASCQDDAAPATTYSCSCGNRFTSSGGTCADVDECALNNGGCGVAQFNHCENNVGAAPDCSDIDECAVDNGGCGEAEFWTCTDNVAADPDCDDIHECVTHNGGCGNVLRAACHENVGAAPTCECADQYGGVECDYHQVYGLDLPAADPTWVSAGQIPYDIDNTSSVAPFDRVAYRLQLDDTWIWVEVDAFTEDPSELGIPADVTFDQAVTHVTVRTNSPNVTEVSDAPNGKIEFWSNCYHEGPDNTFNDDDVQDSLDCFGSLQLHRAGQTLLAVNQWAFAGGNLDVGIGEGVPPDWTYTSNAASYERRRLEVFVHELASCEADSCNGHGSCDASSGIVQCTCLAPYAGVHCQQCASAFQDNDSDGVCEPRCASGACTVPGEYCFDDSGTTECLASQGSNCAAILLANSAAADGPYVVDLDGAGSNDPRLAYCDMSHGGFTLLAVADPRSTAFGNNSPVWSQSGIFGSTSIGLAGRDYRGLAYGELTTNTIRLCRGDLTHCHDFPHGLGISLQAFFATNISYDQYASNIYGHVNFGSDVARTQYLNEIGAAQTSAMCGYWLGINEQAMHSGIGLMGDANDGCGAGTKFHWIDDLAIGVGLQSCADSNACDPLGSKNTAGRQFAWAGQSGDIGPWLILGR